MKNNFKAGVNLDCTTLGPTFVDLMAVNAIPDLNSFVHIHTDAELFAEEDEVEDELRDKLREIRICVDTQDYGCVRTGTLCPGQETIKRYFPEVMIYLQKELDKSLGTTNERSSYLAGMESFLHGTFIENWYVLLSFNVFAIHAAYAATLISLGSVAVEEIYDTVAGLFGNERLGMFDVDVELSVVAEQVRTVNLNVSYPCDTRLVSSTQSCKPYLVHGEAENKIDLLFIGDGYSEEKFNKTLAQLLDYRANATATKYEGLFSREPFKSYKSSFNIWTITTELNHSADEFQISRGEQPDATSVSALSNSCNAEHIFVVSKNTVYTSDCSDGTKGFCALSMPNEPLPGRQLLRLAAKRIGKLADEFTFHVNVFDAPNHIEGFDQIGQGRAPNCQQTLAGAQAAWGNLQSASGGIISTYKGCGGVCGPECENYLRPTFNSPLRNISIRCTADQNCKVGPPYDAFQLVNEQEIIRNIVNATS